MSQTLTEMIEATKQNERKCAWSGPPYLHRPFSDDVLIILEEMARRIEALEAERKA